MSSQQVTRWVLRRDCLLRGPEDRFGGRLGSVVANGDLFGHAIILQRQAASGRDFGPALDLGSDHESTS